MPKQVKISPEVKAVLERGRTEGNLYFLPEGQIDRPLYVECDKVLGALGGKWSKAARAHQFPDDCCEALTNALSDGVAVDLRRTAEQFFTPPAVAAMVFERAALAPYLHVLEPSAGEGALLTEPIRLNCFISAVEQDLRLADKLSDRLAGYHGAGVWACDFITWKPTSAKPIDRVLMNPPFSRGTDMAHVSRALELLRPGGILVSVMSPHWTFADSGPAQVFRGLVNEHSNDWTDLPQHSFRAAGTDVNTGILVIRKGAN